MTQIHDQSIPQIVYQLKNALIMREERSSQSLNPLEKLSVHIESLHSLLPDSSLLLLLHLANLLFLQVVLIRVGLDVVNQVSNPALKIFDFVLFGLAVLTLFQTLLLKVFLAQLLEVVN